LYSQTKTHMKTQGIQNSNLIKKQLSKNSGISEKNIKIKSGKTNVAFDLFEKALINSGFSYKKEGLMDCKSNGSSMVATQTMSLVVDGLQFGYFRIIPTCDGLELSRIQVDDQFRGIGLGNILMAQMMSLYISVLSDFATNNKVSDVAKLPQMTIHVGSLGFRHNNYTQVSDRTKMSLYSKFGFKCVSLQHNMPVMKFDFSKITQAAEITTDLMDINKLESRISQAMMKKGFMNKSKQLV